MYYDIKQNPDGTWQFGEDWYESLEQILQVGICKGCCCGYPQENLEYILSALELIGDRGPDTIGPRANKDEWNKWWNEHQAKIIAHHGNIRAAYFFYYWANEMEFTEHGGAVPGWLTAKGIELLHLLKNWKASQ